jgi:malonyl-CoA O-methyltransferase
MISDRDPIIAAFDAAAETYDSATPVQREVARALVLRAAGAVKRPPRDILDLGAGAGHATRFALEQWPEAEIAALDAAPAMLRRLRAKYPGVTTIERDARELEDLPRYDLILSSMMLHWLDDPRAALEKWRARLAPRGRLCVALPVAGSLGEWRRLLSAAGMDDAIWPFPPENFAEGLGATIEFSDFSALYPDARSFLRGLKQAGAQTPRPGAQSNPAGALRRALAASPGPFRIGFRIAFLIFGADQPE